MGGVRMDGELLQYVTGDQTNVMMGEVGDDIPGSKAIPRDDAAERDREGGKGEGGKGRGFLISA